MFFAELERFDALWRDHVCLHTSIHVEGSGNISLILRFDERERERIELEFLWENNTMRE